MNNYRHTCKKIITEEKERTDSTLTPKQWNELKESMCSEDFLTKSTRGKKARNNVKVPYVFV